MSEISDRLLSLIEEKGYSYGELSKLTGIPKSAIQRYAIGETVKIPMDRIEILAKVLNVSPEYIMGWEEKKKRTWLGLQHFAAPIEKEPTVLSTGELDKKLRMLSPELLKKLIQFIELAEANPESAERFLSFAVQELESSR